jgi:hypothetical protein
VAGLAGWALATRNRVPPLAIAWFVGLWLILAPALWEFGDGVDSNLGLVPVTPSDVTEPARALVVRAEWNSILAGLVILLLAGSALLAIRRRQGRSAPTTGDEPRRAVDTGSAISTNPATPPAVLLDGGWLVATSPAGGTGWGAGIDDTAPQDGEPEGVEGLTSICRRESLSAARRSHAGRHSHP